MSFETTDATKGKGRLVGGPGGGYFRVKMIGMTIGNPRKLS